jgi:hypothetical protein
MASMRRILRWRLLDISDKRVHEVVGDRYLNLYFRQKSNRVLSAAINLRLSFLPSEALRLAHRQALNAQPGQRFTHFVQLGGLDNRHHKLHPVPTPLLLNSMGSVDPQAQHRCDIAPSPHVFTRTVPDYK